MIFFVERVLPRIEQRLPGVTLQVVGTDPIPEVMNVHPAHRLHEVVTRRRVHRTNTGIVRQQDCRNVARVLEAGLDRRRAAGPDVRGRRA